MAINQSVLMYFLMDEDTKKNCFNILQTTAPIAHGFYCKMVNIFLKSIIYPYKWYFNSPDP